MSNRGPGPAEVFPPGEFIRDELEARGWTQEDLAQIMGRPEPMVNLIINDKRGITPETATELAAAFGTSPEFWLKLENAYRLSKVVVPFAEIRERAASFVAAPVKEVEKRGTGDGMTPKPLVITISVSREDVKAIARVLNADANGVGYSSDDGKVRDGVLARAVGQASIVHKINCFETGEVVRREYAAFRGASHRLPRARRVS